MISPKEIKSKAEKWWNDGSFLLAHLKNENLFPKEIAKIGLVDVSKVHEDYQSIIKDQDLLKAFSKDVKGFGYSLEWEEKNYQKIGRNKFVKKIYFESDIDYLKYLGKEKDFIRFKENIELITKQIPELKEWVKNNTIKIVDQENKWEELLKVCKYFMNEHVRGKYYIRELPVSVHTKFIEQNKAILLSLLDFLIPDNTNFEAKNDFCLRYYLKDKENQIRIRILCEDLKKQIGYSDFSIPLTDFKSKEIQASNIFMTENLMNFLTLPNKRNSIAIWSGGGFNVSYIANVPWLKGKHIYYWGDIDVAGFHILSQLRSYYDNVESLMMDKETFDKFYEDGKGKPIPASELKGLNVEELGFFLLSAKMILGLSKKKYLKIM